MASIGYPLRDEEIVTYILSDLGLDYDSLVTSVTARFEPISLNDLYAHLISYELRQELNNSEVQIGSSANNVTRGGFNNNNTSGRGPQWSG